MIAIFGFLCKRHDDVSLFSRLRITRRQRRDMWSNPLEKCRREHAHEGRKNVTQRTPVGHTPDRRWERRMEDSTSRVVYLADRMDPRERLQRAMRVLSKSIEENRRAVREFRDVMILLQVSVANVESCLKSCSDQFRAIADQNARLHKEAKTVEHRMDEFLAGPHRVGSPVPPEPVCDVAHSPTSDDRPQRRDTSSSP